MSTLQQPQSEPTPIRGADTPPPPEKKRKKWPLVLLVVALLSILGIGACAAITMSVGDAVNDSMTDVEKRGEPIEVTEGQEFTLGSHKVLAGWKVGHDSTLDTFRVTNAKAVNTSDKVSTAFLHWKFIKANGEVRAIVDCNTGDLEPGQTMKLSCFSTEDIAWGKYDHMTVEATF